jgi:hypothetical protein
MLEKILCVDKDNIALMFLHLFYVYFVLVGLVWFGEKEQEHEGRKLEMENERRSSGGIIEVKVKQIFIRAQN